MEKREGQLVVELARCASGGVGWGGREAAWMSCVGVQSGESLRKGVVCSSRSTILTCG